MKKSTIYIVLSHILLPIICFSQNTGNRTTINCHNDDLIKLLNDSLIKQQYPEVKSQHIDLNTIRERNNDLAIDTFDYRVEDDTCITLEPDVPIEDLKFKPGQIKIQSGFDKLGAKTYNIPIESYTGGFVLTPEISLSYNSHRGCSLLGHGWDINGISYISPIEKNILFDGECSGIHNSITAAYNLDGIKLIEIERSDNSIKFETIIGNIKVKANIVNNQINSFLVYYPNGNIGFFESKESFNKLFFYISQMKDSFGNEINYEYEIDNNIQRIKRISYNKAEIKFKYKNGLFNTPVFIAGKQQKNTKLLEEITNLYNGNVIGTYYISYSTINNISCIERIGYTGENDLEKYKPIEFKYGDNHQQYGFECKKTIISNFYRFENKNSISTVKGRFDYNAKSDGLIVFPYMPSYWYYYKHSTTFRHSIKKYDNLNNDDDKIFVYTSLDEDLAEVSTSITKGLGFIDILCLDLEGNQYDNIVKINNQVDINNNELETFTVYGYSPSAGIVKKYSRQYSTGDVCIDHSNNSSVHPKYYYTGDFNGDGRSEIMSISSNHPLDDTSKKSKCIVYDLYNWTTHYEGYPITFNIEIIGTQQSDGNTINNNSDKIFIFDYDNDGKSDICHINDNSTDIYSFDIIDGQWNCNLIKSNTNLKRTDIADRKILLGDFNGDGMHDILVSPIENRNDWIIFFSMGDGSLSRCKFNSIPRLAGDEITCYDSNNDGKSDLTIVSSNELNIYNFNYNLSPEFSKDNSLILLDNNAIIVPININSNNNITQFISVKDENVKKYTNLNDARKKTLLTQMTSSLGIREQNKYNYIDRSSDFFERGYNAEFPYINISEKIPVIQSSCRYYEEEVIGKREYMYFNAIAHRQGIGFLGFESIIWHDSNGNWETLIFDQFNWGCLIKEEDKFSSSTYDYDHIVNTNHTRNSNLLKKTKIDKLSNDTIISEYPSYINGYPLKEITTYNDGNTIIYVYKYKQNDIFEEGYVNGIICDKKSINTNRHTTIENYDKVLSWQNNKPTSKEYYVNNNLYKTETIQYNSIGQISETTTTILGDNYTQSKTYNNEGNVVSETNIYGLTTYYTYDYLGRILSVIDPLGNITTIKYDSFGNESLIEYPDGSSKQTEFEFSKEGDPGIYYISLTDNGLKSTTFYDPFGHDIVQRSYRFNSNCIETKKVYDINGNLVKEFLPSAIDNSTTSSLYNTNCNIYTYDSYNRIVSKQLHNGEYITYDYDGHSITENGNIFKKKNYDSIGNLISIETESGSMIYNLRPDGQPISVIAPGNISITFEYDMFNRRIKMNDPSHGTIEYKYSNDKISNIINNGIETESYQYDDFNRMISQISDETTIKYSYNDLNQITKIESTNGSKEELSYNQYGNISSHLFLNSSSWLKKDYTYNAGLHATISYSSNIGQIGIEEFHYNNGYLDIIKFNNQVIYELKKENNFGSPTEIIINNLNKQIKYDPCNRITNISIDWQENTLRNISYSYDQTTSNMIKRFDSYYSIAEMFEYDQQGKLISTNDVDIYYDVTGNIIHKSDIGDYNYDLINRPYSVSSLNLTNSNSIPTYSQTVNYYKFHRPESIIENNITTQFKYDCAYNLTTMDVVHNEWKFQRNYLGSCYEQDIYDNGCIIEKLYIGGNYYNSEAIYIKGNNLNKVYTLDRDLLGSVVSIYDTTSPIMEQHFDAWGRIIEKTIKPEFQICGIDIIGRGYTGHEHLIGHEIINMNARLYDPLIARFLSPDPKIQDPENNANFNRFTYAYNNPFKYKDPNGEFVFGIISTIYDLFKNIFKHGWNIDDYNMKITVNAWRLEASRFYGSFKQIINKNTWGFFNTELGIFAGQAYNIAGKVDRVTELDGVVAISGPMGNTSKAVTIGHVSLGPNNYSADWRDHLFVHEYGHYIQSQELGPFYIAVVGVPSFLSAAFVKNWSGIKHHNRWFETNASRQGAKHFQNKYGEGSSHLKKFDGFFFDINAFNSDNPSLYYNPRTGNHNNGVYPTSGAKSTFWDFIL